MQNKKEFWAFVLGCLFFLFILDMQWCSFFSRGKKYQTQKTTKKPVQASSFQESPFHPSLSVTFSWKKKALQFSYNFVVNISAQNF